MRPNGCLEHAVLFTVRTTDGSKSVSHSNPLRVPRTSEGTRRNAAPSVTGRARASTSVQASARPESNYEPFNSSNINIRYWSWNYRGCWHQTCPPIVTRWWVYVPHIATPDLKKRDRYFSSLPRRFGIGQFTRLLPSVEVVAISQAPSPESNPNSPYPLSPW